MIRLVTFDGDDTLWDFDASMRSRLQQVLEMLWAELPGTEELTVERLIDTRARVASELEGRVIDLKAIRLAAFERSLEEIGRPDPQLAARLTAAYLRDAQLEAFPEAKRVLGRLSRRSTVGVITNGDNDPARVGLEVDFVLNAPRVGWAKPDPRIFTLAMRRAGVEPGESVHVGDSLREDVGGAMGAGMWAVWLNRRDVDNRTGVRPDAIVAGLDELLPVIEQLDRAARAERPASS